MTGTSLQSSSEVLIHDGQWPEHTQGSGSLNPTNALCEKILFGNLFLR